MKNANRDYYVGVDIGTDSVGYAAAYSDYTLVKHAGEPMWGTSVFESAKQCEERRGFRTARRRLDRRQRRVALVRELFAGEIAAVDKDFFVRLKESHLFAEDKTADGEYDFLRDELFDGVPYGKRHPTIHHLIFELMTSKVPHDVRLVYIACAWLVAHRGHFLNEVEKENIENILDFEPIYNSFLQHFSGDYDLPWECDALQFAEVLKENTKITLKEKRFTDLLFGGKKPSKEVNESTPYSVPLMVKLLCGAKVKVSDFFAKEEYAELKSISLGMPEEEFIGVLAELDEDAEILTKLKAMYDWAVLSEVLGGYSCISEAKIAVYNKHKKDLKDLKAFVRKYCPEQYNEIFRSVSKANNYVAYSKHLDKKQGKIEVDWATKAGFSEYLMKALKDVTCGEEDKAFYNDMMERLATNKFLPKQVDGDNRVIPYQLYWYELKRILDMAEKYLPFLKEKDEDGLTVSQKLLSVFEFRIPYYVGPLASGDKSAFAWMKRKSEGKIYPWNFEKMVDLDGSEQEFIRRMTNMCTYLPGEYVLPKNSLLYTKFEVLNEINNIKVNSEPISVKHKQLIYNELFMKKARVTPKSLREFMILNGICEAESLISGIDMAGAIHSSLKVYGDFRSLFERELMTREEAESFITHCTYSEDRIRLKKWVDTAFSSLEPKDRKYLCTLKYKNFGRLSEKLLCGISGADKESGEMGTILYFLWNTNDNLMQLLSEKYTFKEEIGRLNEAYYSGKTRTVNEMLDELYVSNAVKRPILRTLEILNDVKAAVGYAPKKIFVEMARDTGEKQKGRRTHSRKEQITELYKTIKTEDVKLLSKELDNLGSAADNKLQSDALFLYFMQLGKCMYSGKRIEIEKLKTSDYNIDHIYPQCYVKDDSVLNNKVLVLSTYNSDKGDGPVKSAWRSNMSDFWKMLHHGKLITDEKYKRLMRHTPLTNEEKMGFINRQLVETRQATKALAEIAAQKFPETKIVYVKAGLVSEFRKQYDLFKSRSINDLHHAKDAYLNIVVGNVYNERFNPKWFSVENPYSLNYNVIFGKPLVRGEEVIWAGEDGIAQVVKTVRKNSVHFTRYAFCRKGGLFDQQPVKAAKGLVPLKKNLPTEKYGGYNKTTASYFVLVKYATAKEEDLMIMPVELMYSKRFAADAAFAEAYAKETIGKIWNKEVLGVSFPLGKRMLKINTVFWVDGFEMALGGKSSGGKVLVFNSTTSLLLGKQDEDYVKKLERYLEKKSKNSKLMIDGEFDGITAERNMEFYDVLLKKHASKPFSGMKGNQLETLSAGKEEFEQLSVEEQAPVLMNILSLLKTGRTGTADLEKIGGSKNAGALCISAKLSNWKSSYGEVRITDYSPAGIHKRQSANLLDLL